MESDSNSNSLMIIAVIAVIVSAIAFFMVSSNLAGVSQVLLAPNGTTTVQIIENIRIDFTQDTIDFGQGFINPGSGLAEIASSEGGNALNWLDSGSAPIANPSSGFIVENIGNVDVDLSIYTNDTIDNWLSTTGLATLEFMLEDCSTADCSAGSSNDDSVVACTAGPNLVGKGTYAAINETAADSAHVCDPFAFSTSGNEIRIDLNLTLTEGINPTGGQRAMRLVADIVAD